MNRAPLANLFGIHVRDPRARLELLEKLRANPAIERACELASGWLVAWKRLPHSGAVAFHDDALLFAEGGERLAGATPDEAGRLHALATREPARLAELSGDFTLAALGEAGGVTVTRSAGGLAPMYVWRGPESIGFSTLLGHVARFRPEPPRLDPLANAIWLAWSGGQAEGRSLLADVIAVGRGEFVTLDPREAPRRSRYWEPRDRPMGPRRGQVSDAVAEELRDCLLASLRGGLAPDAGNVVSLSGGVDSSALLALASGELGRAVSTVSLVPPDGRALRQRELRYVRGMSAAFPGPCRVHFPLDLASRVALVRAAPPAATHFVQPVLGVLAQHAPRAGLTVWVGGEYADEVCGSYRTYHDWCEEASLGHVLRRGRELPFGRADALRWARHHLRVRVGRTPMPHPAQAPALLHEDVRAEYREWFLGQQGALEQDRSPHRFLHACFERDAPIACYWEGTSELGMRKLTPFQTRRVVELGYEQHPLDVLGPSTKRFLRRALAPDVPTWALYRPDKGSWGRPLAEGVRPWREPIPPAAAALLAPAWASPPPIVPGDVALRLATLSAFVRSLDVLRADAELRVRAARLRCRDVSSTANASSLRAP